MRLSKSLLLIGLISFLAGCRKEQGHASWDTGIVMPLAKTTLSVNDLLPDTILQANADSSLKLVYTNDLYSLMADSIVSLPDTTIIKAYNYTFGAYIDMLGGDYILPNTGSQTHYNLNGPELIAADVRSGGVTFKIINKVKAPIRFNYRISSATQNSAPFDITITIPAATASSPGMFQQHYDLSGYWINLAGPSNNSFNTVVTSSWAQIDPSFPGTVRVYNYDSLITNITFEKVVPNYASGYFGQTTVTAGPETTPFSIFSKVIGGSLQIEDVKIDLQLQNGIGVDARLNINNLTSINTRTGTSIPLMHPVIGSNININRAWLDNAGSLVRTANSYTLTPQNSNIKQFLENLPDKVSYSLKADVNPLGDVSGHRDFILYGEGLKANLNIELPLSLIASNLALADTLDLSIDQQQADKIKQGTFTLFANNGFPFDAAVQLYILDANSNRVDSIMPLIDHIDEAPVGTDLKVISKKLTKLVIPVNESRMRVLLHSKKLLLVTTFNTTAQPSYIKIYSDYTIDLKLTGDFDYELEVD
jgi:hypothetical protein